MKESLFQANLIKELKERFDGCIILKNDANYIQGFPDLLILHGDRWAALECKASTHAPMRPNQAYYLQLLGQMGYANVVCPENKDLVIEELIYYFYEQRSI